MQRGELNELQRKSPEDLWKQDLAVFVEELEVRPPLAASRHGTRLTRSFTVWIRQKLEAVEREELSSGKGIKLVKGKVGKPKVKKMNLEETLPSPFARRVEPPTQPIKADAAKKLTKKKKVRGRPSGTRRVGTPTFSHVLFFSSERRRSGGEAGV